MSEITVKGIIEVLLKGTGSRDATAGLESVQRAAKGARTELDGMSLAAGKAKGYLLQALAGFTVGSIVKKSIEEFASLERALNATALTMNRLGMDSAQTLPRVRSYLRDIALGGGPLEKELLPVFQKFLTQTKNVDAALFATKLAADASESGLLETAEAASHLSGILQGRVGPSARGLGLEVKDAAGKVKDAGVLVEEATKTFDGMTDAFDDTKNGLDKLAAGWEQVKLALGELFGPLIKWVGDFVTAHNKAGIAVGAILQMFGTGFQEIVAGAKTFGQTLVNVFDLGTLLSDPKKYISNFAETFREGSKQFSAIYEQGTKTLESYVDAWYDAGYSSAENFEKGKAAFKGQAGRAETTERAKAEAEAERKAREEALRSQLSGTEDLSAEKLRIERALLDVKKEAEIAAATESGISVQKIEEDFRKARIALDESYATRRATAQRNLDEKAAAEAIAFEIKSTAEGSAARLDAELRGLAARRDAAIREAKERGLATSEIENRFAAEEKEIRRKNAEDRAAIEREADAEILNARRKLVADGSDEALSIERDLLRLKYEEEIANADRTGRDVAAIRLAWKLEELAMMREAAEAEVERQREEESDLRSADSDARVAYHEEALSMLADGDRAYWDGQRAIIDEQAEEDRNRILDSYAAKIESEENAGKDTTKIRQAMESRLYASEARFSKAKIDLARAEKQAKQQLFFDAANTILASLTTIFGKSKGLAIAGAIINTAEGATKALAQGGFWGIAMAAAVIAAGIKQISLIRKQGPEGGSAFPEAPAAPSVPTEPATRREEKIAGVRVSESQSGAIQSAARGSGGVLSAGGARLAGFDDAANDRIALLGGRRWADDLVRMISRGFGTRLEEITTTGPSPVAGAASLAASASGGAPVSITIHGMYGGKLGLRALRRELEKVTDAAAARRVR